MEGRKRGGGKEFKEKKKAKKKSPPGCPRPSGLAAATQRGQVPTGTERPFERGEQNPSEKDRGNQTPTSERDRKKECVEPRILGDRRRRKTGYGSLNPRVLDGLTRPHSLGQPGTSFFEKKEGALL